MKSLCVVMPVYNEEAAIAEVVAEWLPIFRKHVGEFTFLILNDGSRDRTGEELQALARQNPELLVVDKTNSGHGQTCIAGYRRALAEGAEWIFQIDSDGQCDPKYFPGFWNARASYPVQYGYRQTRDDGFHRFLISRVVALTTGLATRRWIKDPNVPYRLMHRDSLTNVVNQIPPDFHLANILVATLQTAKPGIAWRPIGFRQRRGGAARVRGLQFAKQGWTLFRQLRATRD